MYIARFIKEARQALPPLVVGPVPRQEGPPDGIHREARGTGMEMTVWPGLDELLGIRTTTEERRAEIDKAEAVVQHHLDGALRRLAQADTRRELIQRGMAAEVVEKQMRGYAEGVLQTLRRQAAQGEVVFTRVPRPVDFFDVPMYRAIAAYAAGTVELATTTATPATTPAAPQAGPADPIHDRASALAALADFETRWRDALPQWGGVAAELVALGEGCVVFRSLDEMLRCFPRAIAIVSYAIADGAGIHSFGRERVALRGVYPRRRPEDAPVQRAGVGRLGYIVASEDDVTRVRYSRNGRDWVSADLYTDAVVEQAKVAMWLRICTAATDYARELLQYSLVHSS